jgi:RNA polymerase-binding transcription factor DksA
MTIALAELEKIKQSLMAEKERLEQELASFTERNAHNRDDYAARFPSFGSKDDENAAEVSLYSDSLSLERRMETDLRDVNNALKRLALGNYGKCQYCGKEIDLARLLARPVSSSCVHCKETLSKEKGGMK